MYNVDFNTAYFTGPEPANASTGRDLCTEFELCRGNRTDSEIIIQAGGIIKKNYSRAKMHDISKQNKNKSMIRKLRCDTAQDAVASQPEYCIA